MLRQGDILLIPVETPVDEAHPEHTVKQYNRFKRLVLAQGESSLHEHTMDRDAKLIIRNGRHFLDVPRSQELVVTDAETGERLARHTPVLVPPGRYEMRLQRRAEVSPKGWARVAD